MPIDPNEVVWDAETPTAPTTKINPAEVKWDEPVQPVSTKPDAKKYMQEQFKNVGKPDPISQALMHIGSSIFAKPASEIAGLSAMGTDIASGDVKNSKAKEFQDYVRNKLTYEPETKAGEVASNVAGLPGKAVDWASGKLTSGLKDHPTIQAGAKETLNQLANFIGLKGGKSLKENPKFSDASVQAAADAAKVKNNQVSDVNRIRQQSADVGYQVPSNQAKASLVNHLKEIVTGGAKKSEGKASEKNAEVTDNLVRKTLGMDENIPLTPANLQTFITEKGKINNELEQFQGTFGATPEYRQAVESVKKHAAELESLETTKDVAKEIQKSVKDADQLDFSPKKATLLIEQLRSNSAKNKSSNLELSKAQKTLAVELEKMVTENLNAKGASDLAQRYKDSREKIAQAFTVKSNLDASTGHVNAKGLFDDLNSGKMVGGEMRKAAEFAGMFPRSAQKPKDISSMPAISGQDLVGAYLSPVGLAKAAAKPIMHLGSTKAPQPLAFKPPATQAALNQILKQPGLDPAIVTLLSQKLKQKDEKK